MLEMMLAGATRPKAIGQTAFTAEGSYTWVVPDHVYSVSVVAVGSGNPAALSGHTHFNNALIAYTSDGTSGGRTAGADGGGDGGDGGSGNIRYVSGGTNYAGGGGGGAGGYTSRGDHALDGVAPTTSAGGVTSAGGGGGGVGLYGYPAGESGPGAEAGRRGYYNDGLCGLGRSGGTPDAKTKTTTPGQYGGGEGGRSRGGDGRGGGGLGYRNNIPVTPGQEIPIRVTGNGAVRIIWPGDERQFPSTRVLDEVEE